jgi:hypothetical protein
MNPLSTLLDRDYLLDLRLLRQEFAAVDVADPASLRQWFSKHHYLAPNDHARIAGVCLKTIQRWQDIAGMPRARRRRPPGWRRPRPVLVAPADWGKGTWLEDRYAEGYGIRVIARAVNRSYTATRRQLRRRGVVFYPTREAVRSRHPCCNRGWLLEHYVVERLSLTHCARLAGASTYTLTSWLHIFEIRVRSNSEQQMANDADGRPTGRG